MHGRSTRVFGVGLFNDVTQILPRPRLVATATKFETKFAITELLWETSPRCLRLVWGFRDRAIEWRQTNSVTTYPGCHGNEIRDKFGYITRLVYEISRRSLRPTRDFRGRAIEWCHINSTTTDPGCHGNEIWDKVGNKLLKCKIWIYYDVGKLVCYILIKEELLAYEINYLLSHNKRRHCWSVRIPLPSAVKEQIWM